MGIWRRQRGPGWDHDRMKIYEDERTVARSDFAAWLRQLADQLDSDGQVFYGAGGRLTVADEVRCEVEVERNGGADMSLEIEFTWTSPEDGDGASRPSDQGDEDAVEAEEQEPEDSEESEEPDEAEEPEDSDEPKQSDEHEESRSRRRVTKRSRPAPRRSPAQARRS